MWVETPDLIDFANGLAEISNREELIQRIKRQSLERGFKLILPYGKPEGK